MDAEAIGAVTVAVVMLTQVAKWYGVDKRHSLILVLGLSFFGVALCAWAAADFGAETARHYFAAFALVVTSSAGVWGFTRATSEQIGSFTKPK